MCLQNIIKSDLLFELEPMVEAFKIVVGTHPFFGWKKIHFYKY